MNLLIHKTLKISKDSLKLQKKNTEADYIFKN